MEIAGQSCEGVLVIRVIGRVTESEVDAKRFAEQVSALAGPVLDAGKPVVFDLSQCDHLHGGFRTLMNLRRNAPDHAVLAMAALRPVVREKCTIGRIDRIVPVYETVQQAIAAVTDPPIAVQTMLGFRFASDLSFADMKSRLCDVTRTQWQEGDSALLDDYLGGRLTPEAIARFYKADAGYVVNLRFYSKGGGDAVAQLELAKRRLLDEILPAVGCRNPTPCEPRE